MHFIKRSQCPDYLAANQEKWTKPWVAHYRWQAGVSKEKKQPKIPNDGHWRDDQIRLPLIDDFHNNCGYCGVSLPTPQDRSQQSNNTQRISASKGTVDHLLPKSIKPELVYEWTNFIWSCNPCNLLQKKEFYSQTHPLLNPCCEEDCLVLNFIEDTGQYALQKEIAHDNDWQQRLKNNEQKTLINAVEICQERRNKISSLRQRFVSINNHIKIIKKLWAINPGIADSLEKEINCNINEIGENIIGPSFYVLLQDKYKSLLQQYPNVAERLESKAN